MQKRELEVILSFMRGTGDVMEEQVRRLAKLDVHALRPVAAAAALKVPRAPAATEQDKAPARRARREPA